MTSTAINIKNDAIILIPVANQISPTLQNFLQLIENSCLFIKLCFLLLFFAI